MKKQYIILLIAAITLSLLGLIGIQLYWMRSAHSVREANFDRAVSEAASRAVQKFNKMEMARRFVLQQDRDKQINQFYSHLDSLNQTWYNQLDRRQSGLASAMDTLADQQMFARRGYLPGPDQRLREDPIREFFNRSRMINDLFDDLFSNRYSFHMAGEEGVSNLDSLLNEELRSQGLKTPFEFGIYNPVFNSLMHERTGQYTLELLQSPYVYSLFPNDIFLNPEYLLLFFPQQKTYIFSQMTALVATSSLLIIIIISTFGFTIFTVIRQKKLSVMKNDFINNMTHELKTPISTISLACQALSDKDVQKSESLYQSYINVINEENQRLGLMTEKVLQTAIIEKGRIRLNKTGIDLHELLRDTSSKIGIQAKARHGEITLRTGAEYPFVMADRVHLSNVFFNLLDNAIKYTPVNPQIVVSTENTTHGVLIHVDDNGIGISRANQKKIFDNLYRVSTGNIHDVKGFGLGLGYVKAIVEQHGGWVGVESELKKGSRFTAFIPFGFGDKPQAVPKEKKESSL